MDPVTIVTAAASLAGAVLKASFKVIETIDAYDDAPQNVSDVAEEIHAVQIALRQVESVVLQDPEVIDRLGLEDVFAMAVNGCHATLLSISKQYEELFLRSDWKTKLRVLWKDGEMTRLLGRLDRKKATLALLTQTLNLRSTQDIKQLLTQNQSTLIAAKQDIGESTTSYPGLQTTSPDCLNGDSFLKVPINRDSVLSITEFDFDYDLINTKTYRRALARYAGASKTENPFSDSDGEDTPASLEAVSEEGTEDAEDLIELPSENTKFHTSLSRATTLRPDLEDASLDFPPATPPKDQVNKLHLAPVGSLKVEESELKPASGVAEVIELLKAKKRPGLSARKKLDKRLPRNITPEVAAEKFQRRRRHGKTSPLDPLGSSSPSKILATSPNQLDGTNSLLPSPMGDLMDVTDTTEKSRSRRKGGHHHAHRKRLGRGGSHGVNLDGSSTTSGSVESVGDALGLLSLQGPVSLGRERGRRRQAA